MAATSAGLLLHRVSGGVVQVLLVHPGGPFYVRKDEGAWSIPKGEHGADDHPHATALREFEEEIGRPPPPAAPEGDRDLGQVVQRNGKRVRCFARSGDLDVTTIASNEFELEWPPRSGRVQRFPEVDRAEWFDLPTARRKLNPAQAELIDRLEAALA